MKMSNIFDWYVNAFGDALNPSQNINCSVKIARICNNSSKLFANNLRLNRSIKSSPSLACCHTEWPNSKRSSISIMRQHKYNQAINVHYLRIGVACHFLYRFNRYTTPNKRDFSRKLAEFKEEYFFLSIANIKNPIHVRGIFLRSISKRANQSTRRSFGQKIPFNIAARNRGHPWSIFLHILLV